MNQLLKLINSRKRIIGICFLLLIAVYFISGFYNPLILTDYNYTSSKVPVGFDGYRIVHISDFHCKEFGTDESELIAKIRKADPDLIVFTGDSLIKNTLLTIIVIFWKESVISRLFIM